MKCKERCILLPTMNFASTLIPMIRQRAAAVEQALADLPDAALWERRAGVANPAGNLALHLAGNLMNYIGKGVGGREYDRNRPWEFHARDVPRDDVLSRFRDAVETAVSVLESVDDAALAEPYGGPEFAGHDKRRVVLHSVEHLGYHAGQLVLLAKLLVA